MYAVPALILFPGSRSPSATPARPRRSSRPRGPSTRGSTPWRSGSSSWGRRRAACGPTSPGSTAAGRGSASATSSSRGPGVPDRRAHAHGDARGVRAAGRLPLPLRGRGTAPAGRVGARRGGGWGGGWGGEGRVRTAWPPPPPRRRPPRRRRPGRSAAGAGRRGSPAAPCARRRPRCGTASARVAASSQERVCRRPSTYTCRPWARYSPHCSASLRQATTECHSVCSWAWPSSPRQRRLVAREKVVTASPAGEVAHLGVAPHVADQLHLVERARHLGPPCRCVAAAWWALPVPAAPVGRQPSRPSSRRRARRRVASRSVARAPASRSSSGRAPRTTSSQGPGTNRRSQGWVEQTLRSPVVDVR